MLPVFQGPVNAGIQAAFRKKSAACGRQLFYPAEDAVSGRSAGPMKHDFRYGIQVDFRLYKRMREQALISDANRKLSFSECIEKRLDTHSVSCNKQPPVVFFPDGEREDAVEL